MKWIGIVFSLQLRKLLSYRLEFWMQFLAPTIVQLGIAFFLWRAVFEAQGVQEMAGYDLHSLMLYFFFVTLSNRIVAGGEWRNIMADDIYEGNLSKYLVYPIPYFLMKAAQEWATSFFAFLQLLAALAIYLLIFGEPEGINLSLTSLSLGFVAALVASQLSILMGSLIDMVAFWADNVWSLQVMQRFFNNFFGGGLIPLALFPLALKNFAEKSPFACLVNFPVQSFLGMLSLEAWASFLGLTLFWIGVFSLLNWIVWRRGLRQYAGTGL